MKIIKTSQAMPETGEYVLAWLENTTTPMRAMWVAQFTLPVGDDADPEWGEYSEEKDDYFCPAGWYEMNRHEEQHWSVDGNVVAWCELPRLDAGAAPAAVTPLPALEAPPAVAPQGEYPHEQMDAMALARYKVVPSHASMLWSHAVVAGDGAQQLYVGREVECQNMARKFAGAFLDGAFAFHSMAAAPTAQAAPALEAPAAPAVPLKATPEMRAAFRSAFREGGFWDDRLDYALDQMLAAAPQAPAAPSIPQWIDDPHDIEQGQMLNPAWVKAQAAPPAPVAPAATMFHDAGAIAQCTCGRYTLDRNSLSPRDDRRPVCECGTNHGWSGSFKKPGADSKWHGPAPAPEAAPAAPAVDASPLLAPETELDAVVRDAEQIIRDAEHYRFIKRHRLILSGGTDTFGWPIAPFGDECDRYIAQELATERAAQAKEGDE